MKSRAVAEQQRVMDQAVAMMREAAAQGHVEAQAWCGYLYQMGHGVARDFRPGFMYYDKAAKQGHPGAQLCAASCYETGLGVTQNYQEARRLYALASAQGYHRATKDLNELEEKIRAECPLLGKRVVLTGTSQEDLNSKTGVETSFDYGRDRHVVELDSKGESNGPDGNLKNEQGHLARHSLNGPVFAEPGTPLYPV